MTARDEEHRSREIAQARKHCAALRAALDALRSPTVQRGDYWRVQEARLLQQGEEAQKRLMGLRCNSARPGNPTTGGKSVFRMAADKLSRITGSRWARWLMRRRSQAVQDQHASHSRGRG